MKSYARLLQLTTIVAFFILLLIIMIQPKTPQDLGLTKVSRKRIIEMESDQSFSGAPGSVIEYNIYVINQASSMATYTLTALSNQGYSVEVWRETDQVGGGDIQLIPPQGSEITLDAGEVATLIVRVAIPSNEIDGTVDVTIIEAVNTDLGTSDSVTVTSTIYSGLPHPSNWIQLGSDSEFPNEEARPKKADIKALYYTNNGTHVFFRMAEADSPDPKAFLYNVYLDTRAGGQQIGDEYYDYRLSSDGVLYEWTGTNWIDSGYPTHSRFDGTNVVLWADLNNVGLDTQDIHVLASTETKDRAVKDTEGPYIIVRDNISEIPLLMIPIIALGIYFVLSNRRKKNACEPESVLRAHQ